jgi:hypothetical protein
MIVNFRACGISRDACKLVQTPILLKKKIGNGIQKHRKVPFSTICIIIIEKCLEHEVAGYLMV